MSFLSCMSAFKKKKKKKSTEVCLFLEHVRGTINVSILLNCLYWSIVRRGFLLASKAEFEDAVLLLQRLHKGKCKGPYSAARMMYVQTGFTQVNETLLLPQCPIKQNQVQESSVGGPSQWEVCEKGFSGAQNLSSLIRRSYCSLWRFILYSFYNIKDIFFIPTAAMP